MRVLIEIDDLNKLRVAAIDNNDAIEKLCAINAELTAQVTEKDACIARLKGKLMGHESSLQFIDGLVKEQAERIRRMMAGEKWVEAKPSTVRIVEPRVSWAGGECPVDYDVDVVVKFKNGDTFESEALWVDWSDKSIIAYRIVK